MNIKLKTRNMLVEMIGALFVLLFVYAAISKISDFEKFRVQLGKSPILNAYADLIVWVIPVLEVLLVLCLMIKRFQYAALYAAFSLMIMFSTYIIAILKFSSYIPCSCGGILQNMSWTQHLIFNFIFIGLGIWGILIYPEKKHTD